MKTLAQTLKEEQTKQAIASERMKMYESNVCRIFRAGYSHATICLTDGAKSYIKEDATQKGRKLRLWYHRHGFYDNGDVERQALKNYFEAHGFWVHCIGTGCGCYTFSIVIALNPYPTDYARPLLIFEV